MQNGSILNKSKLHFVLLSALLGLKLRFIVSTPIRKPNEIIRLLEEILKVVSMAIPLGYR